MQDEAGRKILVARLASITIDTVADAALILLLSHLVDQTGHVDRHAAPAGQNGLSMLMDLLKRLELPLQLGAGRALATFELLGNHLPDDLRNALSLTSGDFGKRLVLLGFKQELGSMKSLLHR